MTDWAARVFRDFDPARVLYEDDAEVRDFEHFLLTATGR